MYVDIDCSFYIPLQKFERHKNGNISLYRTLNTLKINFFSRKRFFVSYKFLVVAANISMDTVCTIYIVGIHLDQLYYGVLYCAKRRKPTRNPLNEQ